MSVQRWRKLGVLFDPQGRDNTWFVSHAALPVLWKLDERSLRVYFSGRDADNRAQIGYFDFDPASHSVTEICSSPVIPCGELGTFDDRGATSSCIVEFQGSLFQYYTGWNLGVTVPFYYGIGLAISEDGGNTFRRASAAPVLGRNPYDPHLCASPSILVENGLWRMWYVSGVRWVIENGRPKHFYHIKYAESANGIEWRPTGRVCIDFKSSNEYAIARPSVLYDAGRYRMWFCSRGAKYRIGYAESHNGLDWKRCDENAGIEPSDSGWDSDELAYPFVRRVGGELWMLYNGNGYGKTGIGLAVSPDISGRGEI